MAIYFNHFFKKNNSYKKPQFPQINFKTATSKNYILYSVFVFAKKQLYIHICCNF